MDLHVFKRSRRTTIADFHALLQAVGKTTGREMVLNTSSM